MIRTIKQNAQTVVLTVRTGACVLWYVGERGQSGLPVRGVDPQLQEAFPTMTIIICRRKRRSETLPNRSGGWPKSLIGSHDDSCMAECS
jgi:hypothetical protein